MDATQLIPWRPVALLEKFDRDQMNWVRGRTGLLEPDGDTMLKYTKPYETMEFAGNLLTNTGLNRLGNVLTGLLATTTGTPWNAGQTRLGVGVSATAAAVTDTDLDATPANRLYHVLDASFPTVAAAVVTYKASFADAEANFAWGGWGLDVTNGTTPPTTTTTVANLVNRKVQSMGTKTSGIWALTVTLTFS